MALILDDCVVETSTTTGTGDIALAGAVTGFIQFNDVCATGDRVYYLIEGIDGSGDRTGEWETGYGTYSALDTLARTVVQKSSNANAAVNFSAGTKRVMIALTAGGYARRGALTYKAADLTAQNLTTAAAVTWDTDSYDTHAFHDVGSNTSRMTIPAGACSKVRLKGQITLASATADIWLLAEIRKNGSASYVGAGRNMVEVGTTTPSIQVETGIITVAAADYFELFITVETDTSVTITAATSWFQLEVLE